MATQTQELKSIKTDLSNIKSILKDETLNGHDPEAKISQLQQMASNAGQSLKNFFSARKKQFIGAKDNCETAIKTRPFTSAAVAFIGGALLMSLIRRR